MATTSLGAWSYIAGLVIAGVLGYLITVKTNLSMILSIALILLGLIVGLLNLVADEIFLLTLIGFLFSFGGISAALSALLTFLPSEIVKKFVIMTGATIFVLSIKLLFTNMIKQKSSQLQVQPK